MKIYLYAVLLKINDTTDEVLSREALWKITQLYSFVIFLLKFGDSLKICALFLGH